jgi:hypothetical protein
VTSRRDRSAAGSNLASADRTARSARLRPGDLTPQHRHLMPQHHNLSVLGRLAAAQQRESAEHPGHDQVEQTKSHEPRSWPMCLAGQAAGHSPRAEFWSGTRMAVWLNVTFCVLSPALAHARRSPLGTGERTRALGRRGRPDVRAVGCVLGPGVPGFCPSGTKGGRQAGSSPQEEVSSYVARVMNRSRMSAPICCPKIGSQNRTPPLPESDKMVPPKRAWPHVRALTCGFAWS